jgi:hypothetical protein
MSVHDCTRDALVTLRKEFERQCGIPPNLLYLPACWWRDMLTLGDLTADATNGVATTRLRCLGCDVVLIWTPGPADEKATFAYDVRCSS